MIFRIFPEGMQHFWSCTNCKKCVFLTTTSVLYSATWKKRSQWWINLFCLFLQWRTLMDIVSRRDWVVCLDFLLCIYKTLCDSYYVVQSAAGEQGAEGQSGRPPVCSGGRSAPCGCSGDLPEKCWAQPRRGPETKRGAAKRHSAVPHQTVTTSHLTVVFRLISTWIYDFVSLNRD